ncbi:MAG TPA: hypothetical protein VG963_07145, partial [Polyangiaceae bacterium]|nr:hypothetical protein [Polyangiaceae bacterium]
FILPASTWSAVRGLPFAASEDCWGRQIAARVRQYRASAGAAGTVPPCRRWHMVLAHSIWNRSNAAQIR